MLYLCRVCALPSLLNTVILLFNLVKNRGQLIHEIPKMANFLLQNGGGGSTYTRGRLTNGKIRYSQLFVPKCIAIACLSNCQSEAALPFHGI